jgi:hypothetical protein
MLLYDSLRKRNSTIIDYLNKGLENGYLCIYASVDIDTTESNSMIDSFSSRMINYKENIKSENLKFINFKPYYKSAQHGNLTLFKELKLELENLLHKRLSEGKIDKILVIADAACSLSENRYFKE